MLAEITPLILTCNEEPNIARTLSRLSWASRIVVVDSFSTDDTGAICRRHPRVEFVQRRFDSFASQCNFGLNLIKTEWVLSLDSDYVLTNELVAELMQLRPPDNVAGYAARFLYCIAGRPLRASLYPPRAVLYRREKARYENDGHSHRVKICGLVGKLAGKILHDDRKPLSHWLAAQEKYAELEAAKLKAARSNDLSLQDRIRKKVILAPALVFFYTLIGKGLILDGWPGWYYVFQRTAAEMILSLKLIEQKVRTVTAKNPSVGAATKKS